MKDYFILRKDHTSKDVELSEIQDHKNIEKTCFEGKKLNMDKPIKARLKNNIGIFPDILIGATTLFIVSDKLKNLLLEWCSTEYIQFLPVELDNVKSQKYYLLNILENIKCFNWDESDYDEFPDFVLKDLPHLKDKPDEIRKLKLIDSNIGERNIFRMYEQSVYVFINSDLKDKFEKNNITGCYSVNISEYKNLLFM